eukprot:Rmarinus@m.12911
MRRMAKSVYDFVVKDAKGNDFPLKQFEGKPMLIINVASKCGFTPQYEGLEKLHQDYKDKGLVLLGFPCNQFGGQEPGSNEEVQEFCSRTWKVTFPVLSKVEVNGNNVEPLYEFLKSEQKGVMWTTSIKWNFTKFLVDKTGKPVRRFSPTDTPEFVATQLDAVL